MHYPLDGFICELRNILGDLWTLDMSGVFDPDLEKIGRAGPTSSKGFRNISRNFHAWINREKKPYLWKCQQWNSEYLSIDPRWKRWSGTSQWLVWRHGQSTYFERHLNLYLAGTRSTLTTKKPTAHSGKPIQSLMGDTLSLQTFPGHPGGTLCHTVCTVTKAEVRPRDQCWSQATKCSFRREDWKQQICMGNSTALVGPP